MTKYNYYIDASTTRSGIVLEEKDELNENNSNLIITDLDFHKFKNLYTDMTHVERQVEKFRFIHDCLDRFTKEYPPADQIVLEGIYINPARLNSTSVLLKLHGFMIDYFIDKELVFSPPASIKKAVTGIGNAKKELVQKTIRDCFDHIPFQNFDQSDAFALYLTEYMRVHNIHDLNGINSNHIESKVVDSHIFSRS